MNLRQRHGVLFGVLFCGCAVEAADTGVDTTASQQTAGVSCGNALSPTEERTALKLIDDICGDTWCEGDNNFAFERLTCRARAAGANEGGSCTLQLRIIPREEGSRPYARVCTTGGFSGFDSLVDTASGGYQDLDWNYYLALTACISELEAHLPR
jgi:hypothetical protein